MSTELTSTEPQSTPRDAGVTVLRALVLCDLVDSTALLEELGDQAAAELMRRHDRLSRALLQRHGGQEIDKTDGFLILFERPAQAVAFALNYHLALSEFEAVENVRLRARVGIHVGEVLLWDNSREDVARGAKPVDVEGLAKPMAARLMALAGPGQTLMSGLAYALAERSQMELGSNIQGLRWLQHGTYRFKGLLEPVTVWEVGVQGLAPFRPPVSSDKALRVLPWWRRGAGIGIAAALLVAAVGTPLYLSMRAQPAIAFAPRDWVVIGDLKNLTADPALREPLETAFRVSLEQSRFVNVVPDLKVRQSLARMNRPRDAVVDREVGAEVALREGARALIVPTVTEVGGRVRVSAEVIDPNTQTTVYAESADGRGAESALGSMDTVTRELRGRLGEAMGAIEGESMPLDKVTTANIDALRAYSLGVRAQARGRFAEALGLYNEAVKLDPEFALAYAGIARVRISSSDALQARAPLQKALSLRERLPAREALHIEALERIYGPTDEMLAGWKRLAEMYPDHFIAYTNYATFAFNDANDAVGAAAMARNALSNFNPNLGSTHYLLAALALAADDFEACMRHLESARELDAEHLGLVRVGALAARRDFAAAEAALSRASRSGIPSNDVAIDIAAAALALDRDDPEAALAHASRVAAQTEAMGPSLAIGGLVALVSTRLGAGLPAERHTLERLAEAARRAAAGDDPSVRVWGVLATLFSAWIEASESRTGNARESIAAVEGIAGAIRHPVLDQLLVAARAELALADERPGDAIALVEPLLDDRTELLVVRVTYARALAAAGRHAESAAAFEWLGEHRGRAWSETVANESFRPLTVGWTTLALREAAEELRADGRTPEADRMLQKFRQRWPNRDVGTDSSIARSE